jgi:4-aminobutyrate aminotransferase/(S)-3-amino-2-methylpropionate transaminase
MDSPEIGGLGGTYAGNPIACAAAHAVLDLFESGRLLQRSEEIGAHIAARAAQMALTSPLIGDIRRLGAMVGIELVRNRLTKEPATNEAIDIVRLACARGVILIPAGTFGNVIRFLTPLTITDEELDEGLDVLARCVEAAGRPQIAAST